jgi:RimJ/RimL family protein N-acetyltransferase
MMNDTWIHVRRLEYDDLETRVSWFNDPSVSEMMMTEFPASLADTQQWFDSQRLSAKRRDFTFWLRTLRVETVAMGGLTGIDWHHRHAEIYVVVAPDLRRRGYGRAAMIWLSSYAFTILGLDRIFLHTLDNNLPAQHLYERMGFQKEGILRSHAIHRGKPHDRIAYGLLRKEWESASWALREGLGLEVKL